MNVLSKQMEHISLTDRIISETTGSLPISVIINDESKMEVVKAFNNEVGTRINSFNIFHNLLSIDQ